METQTHHSQVNVAEDMARHKPGVTYSITQLAEEFGLTTRAIRFYEDKGLLAPERQGQTRIYHPRDRARLILIVRGKNVGLGLAEIREILDLYNLEDGVETQYRVAVSKFMHRIDRLHEQRSDIDLQIRTLQDGIQRLEKFLSGKSSSQTPKASSPARPGTKAKG